MSKLILIRGAICSGKSTTIEALKTRLGSVSVVDMDVFKRLIDYTTSSKWRTEIAFQQALHLTNSLMLIGRDIIVDIHSSEGYQYEKYKKLASENDYELFSFLLRPPLDVCLERNRQRIIPGITYKISDRKISRYWNNLYQVEEELEFDTSRQSPHSVADKILSEVS